MCYVPRKLRPDNINSVVTSGECTRAVAAYTTFARSTAVQFEPLGEKYGGIAYLASWLTAPHLRCGFLRFNELGTWYITSTRLKY